MDDIAQLLGHGVKQHSMTARYVLREAVKTLVPTGTKTGTGTVVEMPRAEAV